MLVRVMGRMYSSQNPLLGFLILCLLFLNGSPALASPVRSLAQLSSFHKILRPALRSSYDVNAFALRQGLTGDPCSSADDCKGARQCVTVQDQVLTLCAPALSDCLCFSGNAACSTSSECDDGELCVDLPDSEVHLCISEQAAADSNGTVVDDVDSQVVSTANETSAVSTGDKLNGASCLSSSECAPSLDCLTSITAERVNCTGQADCVCISKNPACFTDADCIEGESCLDVEVVGFCFSDAVSGGPPAQTGDNEEDSFISAGSASDSNATSSTDANETHANQGVVNSEVDASGNNSSVSNETDSTPSAVNECQSDADCDAGEDCVLSAGSSQCRSEQTAVGAESLSVCISSHHLSEMNREELMYPTNILARVLCDHNNSCATAGHIVKYKGKPMMMATYCGIVECSTRINEVNSLRYIRGTLVNSNSDDMAFTPFAARYNSRFEEALLSVAVRVGL